MVLILGAINLYKFALFTIVTKKRYFVKLGCWKGAIFTYLKISHAKVLIFPYKINRYIYIIENIIIDYIVKIKFSFDTVREHRNELFKFMKEVRSRDPARRMTLRYDKLYIGNDIFFVNDRTRRVERLHQNVDAGTNFSSSLGNLLINDSQVST